MSNLSWHERPSPLRMTASLPTHEICVHFTNNFQQDGAHHLFKYSNSVALHNANLGKLAEPFLIKTVEVTLLQIGSKSGEIKLIASTPAEIEFLSECLIAEKTKGRAINVCQSTILPSSAASESLGLRTLR